MLSRTDDQLYRDCYNAHEQAENAAHEAIYEHLRTLEIETLATLIDPEWGWEKRGYLSASILDAASEVLDEKLEEAVECTH